MTSSDFSRYNVKDTKGKDKPMVMALSIWKLNITKLFLVICLWHLVYTTGSCGNRRKGIACLVILYNKIYTFDLVTTLKDPYIEKGLKQKWISMNAL